MALKITATVVVKKKVFRDEALTPEASNFNARRIWATLSRVIPTSFVDGLVVTVEEVNKEGKSKGLPVGTADSEYESF